MLIPVLFMLGAKSSPSRFGFLKKNRFNEQGLNMFRDQGHMTYLRTFPEITGLPLKEVQCFITVLFCKPGVMPGENSYLQRTLVMLRGKAQDSLNINKHLDLWNGFV